MALREDIRSLIDFRFALLPAVLVVSAVMLAPAAGASSTEPTPAHSEDPLLVPVTRPADGLRLSSRPAVGEGVHLSSLTNAEVPAPSRQGGTYTARIVIRTAVRHLPGGKQIWVARGWAEWSGGVQRLMVLGSRIQNEREWLKVRLPGRPNSSSGWLPRDRVVLRHSPHFLVVSRKQRRLTVFRNGRRQTRFKLVVGKPGTPTPTGLFAIYDVVRQSDPKGFVGPWVVPITAHSDQLKRFDGGPGLVAFHGRDGASLRDPLGSARSHGCIRMNNGRIRQIIKLMTGTAVRIR